VPPVSRFSRLRPAMTVPDPLVSQGFAHLASLADPTFARPHCIAGSRSGLAGVPSRPRRLISPGNAPARQRRAVRPEGRGRRIGTYSPGQANIRCDRDQQLRALCARRRASPILLTYRDATACNTPRFTVPNRRTSVPFRPDHGVQRLLSQFRHYAGWVQPALAYLSPPSDLASAYDAAGACVGMVWVAGMERGGGGSNNETMF